jgi:hypothetical protein
MFTKQPHLTLLYYVSNRRKLICAYLCLSDLISEKCLKAKVHIIFRHPVCKCNRRKPICAYLCLSDSYQRELFKSKSAYYIFRHAVCKCNRRKPICAYLCLSISYQQILQMFKLNSTKYLCL